MEAPEYFHGGYYRTGNHQYHHHHHQQCTPEILRHDSKLPGSGGDHFIVEDLLDFSNEDAVIGGGDGTFDNITGNSTDSSIVTVVDSCNSSFSGYDPNLSNELPGSCRNFPDAQFSGDLCVPYDDLAELEWLSNIVEESFSTEDLQKLQLISGMQARTNNGGGGESETREFQTDNNNRNNNNPTAFRPDMSVPGKARSKRNRAAPCNWSSRLLVLSPTTSSSESDMPSNSGKSTQKSMSKKKEVVLSDNSMGGGGGGGGSCNSDGRKCLHCATDKTPQWRTGPMGPKTLCNACGVRYKSGRLVPEYRPAASPTFVLTQHSNSHRKVLELRRQKEMQRSSPHHHHHHHHQYMHQNAMFDDSSCDDYLIHHHVGPDYRQLI